MGKGAWQPLASSARSRLSERPREVKGIDIDGVRVREGIGRPRVFGFSMIERAADDNSGLRWTLTGYDTHGRPIGVCRMTGRALSCD